MDSIHVLSTRRSHMTSSFTCFYKIPFHKKELDFTCGAAALRMTIHALTGTNFTEAQIVEILGTSPVIGTPLILYQEHCDKISEAIRNKTNFEIEFSIEQNGSFDKLKELLEMKYIVILNHKKLTGESHWAILRSLNDHEITLVDPEFGPIKTYLLDEFDWHGGIKVPTTKAYVAIRLKD